MKSPAKTQQMLRERNGQNSQISAKAKAMQSRSSSYVRPCNILKNFHETGEYISNIGLEKSGRMQGCCHNFENDIPHWYPLSQWENEFQGCHKYQN